MFPDPKQTLLSLLLLPAACLAQSDVDQSHRPEHQIFFASGEDQVQLLELFSSQGCSSCPPAASWMSTLLESPRLWRDLVPVNLHVDYWDHLGWKDPYASIFFSQRHRRYRLYGHVETLYTPAFFYGGEEWRGFFNQQALPGPGDRRVGQLRVRVNEERLAASFAGQTAGALQLNIALLGFDRTTEIASGENQGRQLRENFVVVKYKALTSHSGRWQSHRPEWLAAGFFEEDAHKSDVEGMQETALDSPQGQDTGPRRQAVAFWVNSPGDPSPVQAAGGWLPQ